MIWLTCYHSSLNSWRKWPLNRFHSFSLFLISCLTLLKNIFAKVSFAARSHSSSKNGILPYFHTPKEWYLSFQHNTCLYSSNRRYKWSILMITYAFSLKGQNFKYWYDFSRILQICFINSNFRLHCLLWIHSHLYFKINNKLGFPFVYRSQPHYSPVSKTWITCRANRCHRWCFRAMSLDSL